MMTFSHHYCSREDCQSSPLFPWWLPVITIIPMMTSRLHYCSRDDCQSSPLFPWWLLVITTLSTLMQHLCWLPVVTIVLMMTFQSSLLFLWWLPVITALSTLKQHLCWLSVIIIISVMTSSHHNKRNRGNPCEEPISVQWLAVTSHSCSLEVIGPLAYVRLLWWLEVIMGTIMKTGSQHHSRL